MKNLSVWAVHLLTASGAAIALLAAIAAAGQHWQLVFLLLGIALVIDGIDGPIARALNVKGKIPWFDGATLDLVVDYTTYVLIPAYVLAQSDILFPPYAIISGVVVTIVGALYFADTRMKTPEQSFRGFPAVWNVLVFALMVFKLPEPVTLLTLALAAVLTFSPVEFVHPIRVKRWRPLTLAMALLWGILALWSLAADLQPNALVVIAFAITTAYFAVIGVVLQLTRK